MSEQQHIIRQHVLELEFADESEAEAIQQEVLALFNKVVLPLYDRFFSAYSNPNEIDRIARLELDLGEISFADLETELIDKIADALDEELERLCGSPTFDDPDELAAQLGLSIPNDLSSTETKLSELTAFFEQNQHETTSRASRDQEKDAESEKRRNDLIRFFEQQSQTDDDESAEYAPEADEWEEDEPETLEPVRVEINYLRPDELNSDSIEPVLNSTDLEQKETDSSLSQSQSDMPVSEQILQSNSNILHYFLQTGLFPWWAKNSSRSQLEQAVSSFMQHRPEVLKADLQGWLTHKAMRKRLVAAFSDDYLGKLLELLLPSGQNTDSISQLLRTLTSQSFPSERHRLVFWEELFQDIRFVQQGMIVVPETLIHAVFRQTETIEPLVVKSVVRGKLLTTIDRLFQLSKTHPDWLQLEPLTARFDNHSEADTWFSVFLSDRTGSIGSQDNKPTVNPPSTADPQTKLPDNESTVNSLFMADLQTKPNEDEVFQHQPKDMDTLIALLLKLQEIHATKPERTDVLASEPETIPPIPLTIDPFSESEKLYVRNAGMVLLWPFLERYFEKNGLLTESKFINKQAQEQAAWLLQQLVLVTHSELFEPHIALNKVMVGLQPEAPVHAPELITEEQRLLMDELLTAVMEHVPAWKNLSIENLRKAYLQREGALSARDGQWLLQVKRETYDILLDKLPWPIQLIRLPWLEHLLVVEW